MGTVSIRELVHLLLDYLDNQSTKYPLPIGTNPQSSEF